MEKLILLGIAAAIVLLALAGLGWLGERTNLVGDENTIDKINEFIFGKE